MIQIGKNYTAEELRLIFGENWLDVLNLRIKNNVSQKSMIASFNDFDQNTKQTYISIHNYIQSLNPEYIISVWATGSRIKGTWKTNKEAEDFAIINNRAVKYSDYDFITNAPKVPTKEELFLATGINADNSGGEDFRVLIEP